MPRISLLLSFLILLSTASAQESRTLTGRSAFGDWTTDAPGVRRKILPEDLPRPFETESANNGPKLVKRPPNVMPKAPAGFEVQLLANDFAAPRKIIAAPNGDIFVAESYRGRIAVVRLDDEGKISERSIFAEGLDRPFGIAFYPPGDQPQYIYIANTGSVVRYAYTSGDLKARGAAQTIVPNISAGGQLRGGGHWTRDIVFSADASRMFVSVGSRSNNDDNQTTEHNRACILSYKPDGTDFRLYASGIRNAVGLAIHPTTGDLWGSVNERDGLGDDLVPDYITRIRENGFYGWPWYYIGANQDPKHKGKRPDLAEKTLLPDVLLQAHSASLCITFYTGQTFPPEFRNDALAAQHGSWNRSRRTGYKVIRITLKDGVPTGEYEDFLTGFVTPEGNVWGRPVGITVDKTGALIVSDDAGNALWRIQQTGDL